jgi:hypothetical protein
MPRLASSFRGDWIDKSKPVARRGRKATGLAPPSRPGCRTQEVLAMRAVPSIASGTRHVVSVGLQAILIAAILGLAALAASAVYKPAGFIAGVGDVDAGGRLEATIGWATSASRLAAESGGNVNFAVTRSVADNDPVMWVTNKCYDRSGRLVSWHDRPVEWGSSSSLEGTAGSFDASGVSCTAYATLKPWQSRVLSGAVMTYDVGS